MIPDMKIGVTLPRAYRRQLAVGCLLAAFLCWVLAFQLPFLASEFTLTFPGWVPNILQDRLRSWMIERGRMPVGEQYLWGIISRLLGSPDYPIGIALLTFSFALPLLKLLLAGALVGVGHSMPPDARLRLVALLVATGKWAMADVFVVAMVIVLFKSDGLQFTFHAGAGVYCYASACLLTAAAVSLTPPGIDREPDSFARDGSPRGSFHRERHSGPDRSTHGDDGLML